MGYFFKDATNVKINGGEFNVINGNYTVFDQSRHSTNVNSFNTTNNTTIGSHNDNSRQYYNASGRPLASPAGPNPGASRGNDAPSDDYFPPPPSHPFLGGATNLPPGSTVENTDSFQVTHNIVDGSFNDNSRAYDVPLSAPPRPRKPNVGPQANPFNQQYGQTPHAHPPDQSRDQYTSSMGTAYNSNGTGGPNQFRTGHYSPYSRNYNGRYYRPGQHVSGTYSSYGPYSIANHNPGDIVYMTPDVGQMIKETVARLTGPDPSTPPNPNDQTRSVESQRRTEITEGSDSSTDDETEISDPPEMRGTTNVSAVDATNPAFSHVKSDPQLPLPIPSSISETMNRVIPMHSGTAPPSFSSQEVAQEHSASSSGSSSRIPQHSATLPSESHQSTLRQFGLDNDPKAVQSAVFNTYHGDVQKVDQRHHYSNFASGNQHNTLVKNSYNDNSIQSYAPAETAPAKPSKKGLRSRLGLR
ncbi:hypothetical protein BDN70DRAFT_922872 [Pholiota conissans]|uniref:Uncharacterized protein n=1 Tax=Pholiota conissans TaxID=109636 RepID=A0A9P5YWL9_9AGAR|nr:hypothetical protein BDN70DRAFT_922872 [Pholiota conissans]